MRALSIRQPYAELILRGIKTAELRSMSTTIADAAKGITVDSRSSGNDPRTCYPGSGFDFEVGAGPGRGLTLNLPFDPGAEDADYLRVMEQRVIPKLDSFGPELLLISAGFDAHRDDPLAQINLSEEGFEQMTRMLVAAAERHCKGRIVSALEGGYNLRALGRSVVRHLVALAGT